VYSNMCCNTMATLTYDNDIFEVDDAAEQLHHPHVMSLESRVKELEQELEYHKGLCRQLQSIAIDKAHEQLNEKFTEEAVEIKAKKSGGRSGSTKVDMFVEERLQDPERVVDEIKEMVALNWSKKHPSRGFIREYLRMKYHTCR
jgi:hypothetical protein